MARVRKLTAETFSRQQTRLLGRVAQETLAAEGREGEEVCVVLAGEEMMRDLNRRFARREGLTDVLAFDQMGEGLGDVVVCVPVARRQAREYRHSLDRELALLVAHGVLHLVGWKDDTPARRRRMLLRAREIAAQVEAGMKS